MHYSIQYIQYIHCMVWYGMVWYGYSIVQYIIVQYSIVQYYSVYCYNVQCIVYSVLCMLDGIYLLYCVQPLYIRVQYMQQSIYIVYYIQYEVQHSIMNVQSIICSMYSMWCIIQYIQYNIYSILQYIYRIQQYSIVQYSVECSIQHVGAPCLMFAVSRSCLPQCWSMLGHRHNHQSHIE